MVVIMVPKCIAPLYVSCPGPLVVKAYVSVEDVVISSRLGAVPSPPGGQNISNISDASVGVKINVALWNERSEPIELHYMTVCGRRCHACTVTVTAIDLVPSLNNTYHVYLGLQYDKSPNSHHQRCLYM